MLFLPTVSFAVAALVPQAVPPAAPPTASAPIRLAPPVRLKAGDAFIDMGEHVAHAGPAFLDFDADGVRDLVVGNFSGSFALFRNAGSAREPKLESRGFLEAEGKEVRIHNW